MPNVKIIVETAGAREAQESLNGIGEIGVKVGSTLRTIFETAAGFSLATTFQGAAAQIVNVAREMATLGLETKRQEESFALLTASVGVNGQELKAQLEAASRGIADISDNLTVSARALQEGIKPEQMVALMTVAVEQSKIMGTTVTQAYNTILDAIISLQERGLKRNAQILVDDKAAFDAYGQAIGVNADQLTDFQKRQALVNEVLALTKSTVAALRTEMLTQNQDVEKAATAWANFKQAMSVQFVELMGTAVLKIKAAATETEDFATKLFKGRDSFYAWAAGLVGVGTASADTKSKIDPLVVTAGDADQALAGMSASANQAGNSLEQLGPFAANFRREIEATRKEEEAAARAAKEMADAWAGMQSKLVLESIADPVAKSLMAVRQEVEATAKKYPELSDRVREWGKAMEGIILQQDGLKKAAEALAAFGNEVKRLDFVNTAFGDLQKTIEQIDMTPAQIELDNFRRALEKMPEISADLREKIVTLAGGMITQRDAALESKAATDAVVTSLTEFDRRLLALVEKGELMQAPFSTLAQVMQDIGDEITPMPDAFWEAALKVAVLTDDVEALMGPLSALPDVMEDSALAAAILTDSMQPLIDELAPDKWESFGTGIENAFLSVTDTMTKMVDGLIQGTLNIGDAFKNLGQSLIANFAQVVIHEVFDPVLKAGASFFTGFLKMIFGGGGAGDFFTQGATQWGQSIFGNLGTAGGGANWLASLFGGGGGVGASQIGPATGEFGLVAGGGGGGILSTLGAVGSGISTVASTVYSWVTGGANLVKDAITSVAGYIASLGGGAAGGAAGGGGAAAAGAAGGSLAGAGAGFVLAIPAIASFFATMGQEEIRWNNQRRRLMGETFEAQSKDIGNELKTVGDLQRADVVKTLSTIGGGVLESIGPLQRNITEQWAEVNRLGTFSPEGVPTMVDLAHAMEGQMLKLTTFLDKLGVLGIEPSVAAYEAPVVSSGHGMSTNILGLVEFWLDIFERLGVGMSEAERAAKPAIDAIDEAGVAQAKLLLSYSNVADRLRDISEGLNLGVNIPKVTDLGEAEREWLTTATEGQLQSVVSGFVEQITGALMAAPAKIAGIMDLEPLRREGETVEDTAQRVSQALGNLGEMMKALGMEADLVGGGFDALTRAFSNSVAVANSQLTGAMQTLTTRAAVGGEGPLPVDPSDLLDAATKAHDALLARYQAELDMIQAIDDATLGVVGGMEALTKNAGLLTAAGVDFGGIVEAFSAMSDAAPTASSHLIALGGAVDAFATLAQMAGQTMDPELIEQAIGSYGNLMGSIQTALGQIMQIEDPAARLEALGGLMNVLGGTVDAALAGVAAMEQFVSAFQGMIDTVNAAAASVASAGSDLAQNSDWLRKAGVDMGALAVDMANFGASLPTVQGKLSALGATISLFLSSIDTSTTGDITTALLGQGQTMSLDSVISGIVDAFKAAVQLQDPTAKLEGLTGVMNNIGTLLAGLPEGQRNALISAYGPYIGILVDAIHTAAGEQATAIGKITTQMESIIGPSGALSPENYVLMMVGGIKEALGLIITGAGPLFNTITTAMTGAGKDIAASIDGAGTALKTALDGFKTPAEQLVAALDGLKLAIGQSFGDLISTALTTGFSNAGPAVTAAVQAGVTAGINASLGLQSGTDIVLGASGGVLAKLHPGEMVLNPRAAGVARSLGLTNAVLTDLPSGAAGYDMIPSGYAIGARAGRGMGGGTATIALNFGDVTVNGSREGAAEFWDELEHRVEVSAQRGRLRRIIERVADGGG